MTTNGGRDPFAVDNPRALEALAFAWATSTTRSGFTAVNGAPTTKTGTTKHNHGRYPDELNRAIRADWLRREGQR
jgi:hypothetical protein